MTTTYAVHYTYGADSGPARLEHRDAHIQFLLALQEQDQLLLCGAYSDDLHPGALLVVAADDAEKALGLVQGDPYNGLGLIDDITVREWTSRLGSRKDALA